MSLKVLIVGLDGATWDLIKPWADDGKLPTFKRLIENGTWGYLESTIPPWTIPAWESMSAGKNPKKLGFATFMVKDGYRFVPHIFKHKRQKMIWNFLSDFGYSVIVANLPNLYMAEKINGCVVAGWLCLDKDKITYPPNLINELNEYCNEYEIDIFDVDFEKGQIIGSPDNKNYLKRCEEILKKHFLAFTYLLKKYKWDFGFIVFATTDRVQHKYWNNEILLEHYKKIDRKIKELLEMICNETIVFFVSDHGFGRVKYTFNINEFLIKEGYLKLKDGKQIKTFSLFTLLRKSRLFPVVKTIFNLLPSIIAKSLKEKAAPLTFEKMNVDWNNTKAFAYGVWGDIYLNIRGREPNGIVDPEDYSRIQKEIIEKIKNIKYNGEKLNILIFKKQEVYHDVLYDNFPDLIIIPTDDGIQAVSPSVGSGEMLVKSNSDEGNHRLYGIFLAYGPGIKKDHKIENAKIYDIAPTILHIFGLPIPNDMDGKVLMDIFEEDSEFAKRKPRFVDPSYYEKKQEDEKLKKAIKNLKATKKL